MLGIHVSIFCYQDLCRRFRKKIKIVGIVSHRRYWLGLGECIEWVQFCLGGKSHYKWDRHQASVLHRLLLVTLAFSKCMMGCSVLFILKW